MNTNVNPETDPTHVNELTPRIFAGMKVVIENPKGSVRKGIGKDGKPWETTMAADYGYFPRHTGGDGEGLDCYLGDNENYDDVHIVHQNDAEGKWDEDKVMAGYNSPNAAKLAYLAHIPADRFRSMTTMPTERFKAMLTNAEPGSAHWKRKHGRGHETTALMSRDNLLITTYGVETPETMNAVIELARAPLACCPGCKSHDVIRLKARNANEGPRDKCVWCGSIWSHKPGTLTAKQHAEKYAELARQSGLGEEPYPDVPGTTNTAGYTEEDPPVEEDEDEGEGSGQSNESEIGEGTAKIKELPELLSKCAKSIFGTNG